MMRRPPTNNALFALIALAILALAVGTVFLANRAASECRAATGRVDCSPWAQPTQPRS